MVERETLVALVRGLQQGEESAATQIYELFQNDIYYFILKTVNNDKELAEDLTQDTFVTILETIGTLQEPAAFVTWSKQIAYHKCTDFFKKRREILADEDEDGFSVFDTAEEEREEFIPDAALDKEDLKQTILAMLNELPSEQRSALVLRYFNEIPVKEIAEIQGVTEGTVKSRLNYGRKALKQAVEDYEKKNGIKLRCVGILPMLLWFFRQYRVGKTLSMSTGTATQKFIMEKESAGAAAAAGSAPSAGAVLAEKTTRIIAAGGKAATVKIIAGILVAGIVIGGVAFGIAGKKNTDGSEAPMATAGTTQPHMQATETEQADPETNPATVATLPATATTEATTETTEETQVPAETTNTVDDVCDHSNYYEQPYYVEGQGYTGYYALICADCEAVIQDNLYSDYYAQEDEEEICEHEWRSYHEYIDENTVYSYRQCEKCGLQELLDECDHDWKYFTDVHASVIEEYKRCTKCNYYEEIATYPNTCAHQWEVTSTSVYEDSIGTHRKCKLCEATQNDWQDNPCKHQWEIQIEYSGDMVVKAERVCTLCSANDRDYDYRDYCTHEWGSYSDYDDNGREQTYQWCRKCGKTELVSCEHEWHTYQEYEGDVLIREFRECTKCGVYEEFATECEHVWEVLGTIESESGIYQILYCDNCGLETQSEPITCDHQWVSSEASYCGDNLFFEVLTCTQCGMTDYAEYDVAHQWVIMNTHYCGDAVFWEEMKCANCDAWDSVTYDVEHQWVIEAYEYCGETIVRGEKHCQYCDMSEAIDNPDAHQWERYQEYDASGEVLVFDEVRCKICDAKQY